VAYATRFLVPGGLQGLAKLEFMQKNEFGGFLEEGKAKLLEVGFGMKTPH